MSQRTLADFTRDKTVPDRVLEWANRFKHARMEPIPRVEEGREIWKERARSRGFCPNCWLEFHSHPSVQDYHRDDRRDPITESDEKAHAYAENHRHEL